MGLLVFTQKVDENDDVLGFFHDWLIELSKHFEKVYVVALYEGSHHLPSNITVCSLGKEKNVGRLTYILRFYAYLWRFRNQYDCVFVHMNQIYVILGGIIWRMLGKKITLWYTHRKVSFSLQLATFLADAIATASRQSFNIRTKKVFVLGHGISFDRFSDLSAPRDQSAPLRVITVGRITPIKHLETLIGAISELHKSGVKAVLDIVGDVDNEEDTRYKEKLLQKTSKEGLEEEIRFSGRVPNRHISRKFFDADVSVNLAPTGGIDKTVIESFACGVPSFVTNESFREHFGEYADFFMFRFGDEKNLAKKISNFISENNRNDITENVRSLFEKKFNLPDFMNRLVEVVKEN